MMRAIAACSTRFAALASALALILLVAVPCAWADEQGDQARSAGNQVYVNQLPDSSFLDETSIADLAQADSYYDGQTVLVKGEVVGDAVNDEFDGSRCWLTLQDVDDRQSVASVSIDRSDLSLVDTFGGYQRVGTMLQVSGTFNLKCREHQGLTDIHATDVASLSKGSQAALAVDGRILAAGVAAMLAGAALMGAYYLKRERTL